VSRDRFETVFFEIARWVTIVVLLVACLFPFYYMVLLSLRSIQAVLLSPGDVLPSLSEIGTRAYGKVLRSTDEGGQGFISFLRNSLFVAAITVAVTLAAAIPGAYAIARLRFRGDKVVSLLFLSVYLFPPVVLAIPLFSFFTRAGLRGSLIALAFVYIAQTLPVAVYMLRGYFATIPVSLEEAAVIDGCSRFNVIRRVSLPLAMPLVVATGLYVFLIAWNEFLFALLFLVENRDHWTVPLGLSQLAGSIEIPTTTLMAGSVVITLPILVIFFFAERALVEGLTAGAEKG